MNKEVVRYYIHEMEYFSATKRNKLLIPMNNIDEPPKYYAE
jgi:hypothetical protein